MQTCEPTIDSTADALIELLRSGRLGEHLVEAARLVERDDGPSPRERRP